MRTQILALAGTQGMFRKCYLSVIAVLVMFGLSLSGLAQAVTLTPSVASPQMLGTSVTWTAAVQNPIAGHTYGYRFSATFNGISQIVQDYSPANTFTWTPFTVEGAYKFSVAVRDTTATPFTVLPTRAVPYTVLPWVTASLAAGVVNTTVHPLVAYFSAPPCADGDSILVRFHQSGSSTSMTTNSLPCTAHSANWYVAGMYPSSQYLMHWEEYNGDNLVHMGGDLSFATGSLPSDFPTSTFTNTVPAQPYDAAYPLLLFSVAYPTATDLSGNVLWYFPHNLGLTLTNLSLPRMEPNGLFYSIPSKSILEQYNLSGNLILQTNLDRLNEQLVGKGYPAMSQINSHEVRNLPDGNVGLLGLRDVKSTTAQGGTPTNPVTIEGDMVVVMDHNLQVIWAWDSFAHQDINRVATNGDKTAGGSNDWTHTNALQGTEDGNIIISERSQDMVLKINYANGKGDGSVLWKLGAGLDFTVVNPPTETCNATTIPGNPNIIPWFTHQHDSHFDFGQDLASNGFMILTVFDDGNTRHLECSGTQNSRGMIYLIDEAARQVYIETSADLGGYSFALGSAQLLTPGDGNSYASFDSGILPGGLTQVSEVNLAGQIVYQMATNQQTYRAYRMQNLYTPSEFENDYNKGTGTGVTPALPPPDQPFDFNSGFAQYQDILQFNGSASLAGSSLQVTDSGQNEAGSVFFAAPVDVGQFTADFTFQLKNALADGFTFTIQGDDPTALGGVGGYLGYEGIGDSVAVKFDLHQNSGDPSNNSTGIFINGAKPIGQDSIDLTGSGIDLHSGDIMDARLIYNGTTLNLTITDMVTSATWSHAFTVNIPATVGGDTAFVGFTGATGGSSAVQQILSWSYRGGPVPNNPTGFPVGTGLTFNGSAALSGSSIMLTDGGSNEAGSVFYNTPVNVQAFTNDFDFQLTNAQADGFTFTIQGNSPTALGSPGGSLGYRHIMESVAVKFDLYDNEGEGANSTGIYTDGAYPTTASSIDLTGSGIDLHSGDPMHAHITYDGQALSITITDLVTLASWSQPFVLDIPGTVGGDTAYVGFTAGTGGRSAIQQILNWTFD